MKGEKMKKMFKCDYCDLLFYDEGECVCHENDCSHNPKIKACDTCKYMKFLIDYECTNGIGKVGDFPAKNCPKWEFGKGHFGI